MTAPVQSLADLIAEVAAEHQELRQGTTLLGWCACGFRWSSEGCTSRTARLAAALSVENVAAGLQAALGGSDWYDWPKDAAALLAAITVAE